MAKAAVLHFSANAKEVIKAVNNIESRVSRMGKNVSRDDVGKPLAGGLHEATGAAGLLKSALAGIGIASFAAGAMKAVGAMKEFATSSIAAAAEMEDYQTRFTSLLGDQVKAESHVAKLTKYAATTPFDMGGISNASASLLAFGVDAQDSMEVLRMLGDVAAATGGDLAGLALIYGKANTAGKLDRADINQLGGRGVNVAKALAERDGRSVQEVQKGISKGEYNVEDLRWVLEKMTSEGGLFFGATQALGEKFNGAMSTLQDTIKLAQADMGKMFLPAATDSLKRLSAMVENVVPAVKTALGDFIVLCKASVPYLKEMTVLFNTWHPAALATREAMAAMIQPFSEFVRLTKEVADLEAEREAWVKEGFFTTSAEIQAKRQEADLALKVLDVEKEAAEAAAKRAEKAREARRESIQQMRQELAAAQAKRAADNDRELFGAQTSEGMRAELATRFLAATGQAWGGGFGEDEAALAAAEQAATNRGDRKAMAELAALREYSELYKKTQAEEVEAADKKTEALDKARAAEVHAAQLADAEGRKDYAEVQRLKAERAAESKFSELLRLGMSPEEAARYAAEHGGREHGYKAEAKAGDWLRSDLAAVGGGGAARRIPNAQLELQRKQLNAANLTNNLLQKLLALPRSVSIPVTA